MIYDGGTTYRHTGTVITKALNKRQARTFAINEGIRKHNPEGDSIEIETLYKLYGKTPHRYWKKLKLK